MVTIADLQSHFDSLTYDKAYQNVDVLNMTGYDNSLPTLEKIQGLPISFTGKTVCDLGCFHGYFTIHAKKMGASSVIGLDRHVSVLATSRMIASCEGVDVSFQEWVGGDVTPNCDIALVLNMLHHCENQALTLQNIQCDRAIFEVNQDQLTVIDSVFKIDNIVEGRSYPDRDSRLILLATKR